MNTVQSNPNEEHSLLKNERLVKGVFRFPEKDNAAGPRETERRPNSPKSDRNFREMARIRNLFPSFYDKTEERKKMEVTDNNYSPAENALKLARANQKNYVPGRSHSYNSSTKAVKSSYSGALEQPYYLAQSRVNIQL